MTAQDIAIGTLCLIDTKPRVFDEGERTVLSNLRDMLVKELQDLCRNYSVVKG